MSQYEHIQQEAYAANMQLAELNLVVFTFGNVSAADRSPGAFADKPGGAPYKNMPPDKMVVVDFEGKIAEGVFRPSSDTKTQAVLYKHWESIGSISHTHSTYTTAWAQSLRDISIYGTTHANHLTADMPCAPPMDDLLIQDDYKYQTRFQIMNALQGAGLSYRETEMILAGNHAPFT